MGWTFAGHQAEAAANVLEQLCRQPELWQQARQQVLDQRLSYVRSHQADRYAQLLAAALTPASTAPPAAPSPAR